MTDTLQATLTVPFVDLKAQYSAIKREIDSAIEDVLARSAFIGGAAVDDFERAFAVYCGVSHCVGVANGTDAIFVALRALGIGEGDEVITVANSFIATAEAIRMAGAKVVFADIDPATYTIDVDQLARKITPRTKAIVPVHLYGHPADMEAIGVVAKRHGLFVVGDAAQAHGATYKGRSICAWADITCFSFYPGKNLGAYGDAGALVTNNSEWAATARMFANHGRTSKYDHGVEGINSRLDGIQAAILAVKLKHLDQWTERRRANAARYNDALRDVGVITPVERPDVRAVYHLYVIRVPAARREGLQQELGARGIHTGIHYPIALPHLAAYRHLGHNAGDFPESTRASAEILSLPMFAELSGEQIGYVADALADAKL